MENICMNKQNVVSLFDYLSSEEKDFDTVSYEKRANKKIKSMNVLDYSTQQK